MRLKWRTRLISMCALLAAIAPAQVVLLTPDTTNLSGAGGNLTFTASISYSTPPSTLGLTVNLPTGWSYVSGTNEPDIKPAAGRMAALEWAYITVPASPATFTFTTAYPANTTGMGLQLLSTSLIARDGSGGTPTTVTGPTVSLVPAAAQIQWKGGSGNWTDGTQWTQNVAPINSGDVHFSATVAAGVATLGSAVTIDNLTFTGGTIDGAGNLTLAGLASTWTSGAFGGLGELIIAPGAQLTAGGNAPHNFSERTIRNQGTFTWVDRGALQSGSGGTFINSAGATFVDATVGTLDYLITNPGTGTFTFTNAGAYQKTTASSTRIDIPFSNTGNIVVSAGTLRFTNTFTQGGGILDVAAGATVRFDNGLNFAAGTLHGGGTVAANLVNDAFISPGNILGTLTIDGNLTLLASSHLQFDIAGNSQGTNYDFLFVRGNATLGGNLTFTMAAGAENTIQGTDTLTLLSSSALTGTFANIPNGTRLSAASGTGSFVLNYTTTSVTLSNFLPIPEPSTWVLLCAGLGALAAGKWRRRH